MALNAPATDVDPQDVLRHAGWDAAGPIGRVEGGWITAIWRFETADGRLHALRLYPPGDEVEQAARREALTLRAMNRGGIPVPDLEAEGHFRGQPYFILSWLSGIPLVNLLEKKIWRLWQLGAEFGRLQARFHRLAPLDLRFENGAWATIDSEPGLSEAVRSGSVEDALCHLDYHPVNVLAVPGGITGVIDFSGSGVADRRADLGRTMALLTAGPIPPSPIKPLLQLLRRQFVRAWRRGYRAEAGDFPLTPLHEAWGAATFVRDIEEAVAEGRGWGTPGDVELMKAYLAARKRDAGIGP